LFSLSSNKFFKFKATPKWSEKILKDFQTVDLSLIENEGVIGELANYFVATTGTGTSVGNAKGFGEEFSKKLLEDGVGAVILTST